MRSARVVRASACAIVLVALVLATPATTPRDVILVSIDTLRADHLGCYGYARPTSPRLDAFAAESVRFTRAAAHAPNTLPSHMALFTSRVAGSFGRADRRAPLPASAVTLAETLDAHGFATWGFTDGGFLRRSFGLAQGFEHYEDSRRGLARLRPRIEAWLDARRDDPRPMFLFVHTYDVHSPYAPPARYRARFVGANASRFEPTTENLTAVVDGKRSLSDADLERVVALYDAGIRYADDQLALLFRALERRGRLQNAIVIVTSDHGEAFLEHGSLLHWQLFFRPNLHVPLIVRVPGRPPGVVDDVVGLIDVVPTVLDLLDLPALPAAMGRSLRPLLDGRSLEERPVYAEPFDVRVMPDRTIVTSRYQLLDRRPSSPRLFDLRRDPYSTRNVWRSDRALGRPLRAALGAARARVDAHATGRSSAPARPAAISPRVRRELEALGYVE